MESVFEAFISNPALYSAGHLVGETLHFPTNTEEVQSLLKRIGVDGVRCQEYFIISFDSDILGLYDYLGEYENIDELNHLAHLLKELSPSERETLDAQRPALWLGAGLDQPYAKSGLLRLSSRRGQ